MAKNDEVKATVKVDDGLAAKVRKLEERLDKAVANVKKQFGIDLDAGFAKVQVLILVMLATCFVTLLVAGDIWKLTKADGTTAISVDDSGNLTIGGSMSAASLTGQAQVDTNATTTTTGYTPAFIGQLLFGGAGTGTNAVWAAKGLTTNDWVRSITTTAIVNANISATAAIAHTKLAPVAPAYLLVGNASSQAVAVAVSGDITMSNAGVVAIAAGAIVAADVNATGFSQADTNATTTATGYTPAFRGQVLIGSAGTGTNAVWISKGVTTNDWVRVAP